MWFFKRKKKQLPLFGTNIPPDCQYCHFFSPYDQTSCSLGHCETEAGACKKFSYNPFLRKPRRPPTLKRNQFTKEDFEL